MKLIRSLAINFGAIAAAWFATHGNTPCRNIILLLAGLHCFCAFTMLIVKHRIGNGGALPKWLSNVVGVAYLSVLTIAGWWYPTIAFLAYWLLSTHNQTLPPKEEKP